MNFLTLILLVSVATASYASAIRPRKRLWKTIDESEIASYIVGGRDAMDGEAPWQVALQNDLQTYLCGGSIIKERWVITSAACTTQAYQVNLRVRYNTLTLTGGQTIMVQEVVRHPQFNSSHEEYNIALVKVQSPMTLGQMNADLIDLAQYHQEPQEGWKLNITGWGRTTPDDTGPFSENLQLLELTIMNNQTCDEHHPGPEYLHVFCAKTESSNQCSTEGDRGGPGVHDRLLYGVLITWKQSCSSSEPAYEFFTKVGHFYHWIQPIINLPALE